MVKIWVLAVYLCSLSQQIKDCSFINWVSKENCLDLVTFLCITLTCGTNFNTTGTTLQQYPSNTNCASVPRCKNLHNIKCICKNVIGVVSLKYRKDSRCSYQINSVSKGCNSSLLTFTSQVQLYSAAIKWAGKALKNDK